MIVHEVSSIFLDNIIGVGREDEAIRALILEAPQTACGVKEEYGQYVTHECLWLRDSNNFGDHYDEFLNEMGHKHPEYSLERFQDDNLDFSYWKLIHRDYPNLQRYAFISAIATNSGFVESCMVHIITVHKDFESSKNMPSLNVGKANSKFDSGFVGVASKVQSNHTNQIDDPNRAVNEAYYAGVKATTPVARYFLSDGFMEPNAIGELLESREKHRRRMRIMTIIGALLCFFLPIIGNAIVLNKLMGRYVGGLFSLSFWRVMLLSLPLAFLGMFFYMSVLGH